ncbi:MAG: UDP-2,3-diacylglucosamine diphosphatase [Porticoccaceae bacterium]
MSVLFISDLHLSPERPEVTRAFLHFLQSRASHAEALYVLGDLFEAWIGDDDPSDLAMEVQHAFADLSSSGVALYVQQGNRDFLLGKRFASNTGAVIIGDETVIEYWGQRALVMHGDSLCTDDIDYQRFRRKSRNPIYKWFLRALPLRRRQELAADWRAKSRAANSNKPSSIMDVNSDAVNRVMHKHDVSMLIHGHTHRPDQHRVTLGERMVLGDWDSMGWVIEMDKTGYELQSFPLLQTD